MSEITRGEYEEAIKRVEAEEHRQNKRLDNLEESIATLTELTISIEKIAVNIEQMQKELTKQGERLEKIEAEPGENWKKVIWLIVAALVGFDKLICQRRADGGGVSRLRLVPHIVNSDLGQACASVPLCQLNERVNAVLCLFIALDRRCGRGKQHQSPVLGAAEARHVAGVILWIHIGFIGVLLLLVDDYNAYVVHRREDHRASADGDIGLTRFDASVRIVALARRKA